MCVAVVQDPFFIIVLFARQVEWVIQSGTDSMKYSELGTKQGHLPLVNFLVKWSEWEEPHLRTWVSQTEDRAHQ